ncbi:MAG: SDR family NAD(P)-dependent oxidoreductase [bacterium]
MKTIVLTGDSRGLGNTITRTLLESDYRVIGLSRRQPQNFEALKSQHGDDYVHLEFDLSSPEKIEDLYKDKLKPEGPLDGLVNNAALAHDDLVTNAEAEGLETLFQVNVISPILLTKRLIRDMLLHRENGSIVHVSSVSARKGFRGLSLYASTKGALESFSRGVAREWGERDIRSNCVAPGFMETDMTGTLSEDQKEQIYNRTSLGEAVDPESVAESVEFLLSDKASSITGEVLNVDAGA